MAKQYQWKTDFELVSGGFPGEDTGVLSGDTNWHTTSEMSGTATAQYYYRDADYPHVDNANSSRVVITIKDEWTATIDRHNNLTIHANTTIENLVRDDLKGTLPTIPRHIYIKQDQNGQAFLDKIDPVNTVHNIIDAPLVLPEFVFTLAPGEGMERSTVWFRSTTSGNEDLPIPNIYTDIISIGVRFKNILPRDYRPGATLRGAEQWMSTTGDYISHNRLNGACHVRTNNSWQECRTTGGFDGEKGNAPLILTADNADSWRDQKLIGKEQ